MIHACSAERSTLVLIDLQEKLMPALHDGDTAIEQAKILAQAARQLGVPVTGTAQYPKGLGAIVAAIEPLCDKVVEKTEFSASGVPEFLDTIHAERDQVILAGCEAHVCVLQTALGLLERGYDVRIVADAIASRRTCSRDIALKRAAAAGVAPITTEMAIFEWLGDARHPEFKTLSRLIR